jgi:hypothetical protein
MTYGAGKNDRPTMITAVSESINHPARRERC